MGFVGLAIGRMWCFTGMARRDGDPALAHVRGSSVEGSNMDGRRARFFGIRVGLSGGSTRMQHKILVPGGGGEQDLCAAELNREVDRRSVADPAPTRISDPPQADSS